MNQTPEFCLTGYVLHIPHDRMQDGGAYYLPETLTSQTLTLERAELSQRRMADIGYPGEIRYVRLTIQPLEEPCQTK